jgi:hypothetical protein
MTVGVLALLVSVVALVVALGANSYIARVERDLAADLAAVDARLRKLKEALR